MALKYPHTVTAWYKNSEDRTATWDRVVFYVARYEEKQGGQPNTNGDTSERYTLILIEKANCKLKRGDKVLLGLAIEDTPPSFALTVDTVQTIRLHKDVHHYEVIAR